MQEPQVTVVIAPSLQTPQAWDASHETVLQLTHDPSVPPFPQSVSDVPGWQPRFASQHIELGQLKGQGLPQASSSVGSPQLTPQPPPGVQQARGVVTLQLWLFAVQFWQAPPTVHALAALPGWQTPEGSQQPSCPASVQPG